MATFTEKKNRIELIDAIRGFALFGVLLVNLTMIDATLYGYEASPFAYDSIVERFFAVCLDVFFTGKFYSLFAILFGIGFTFFMNRANHDQLEAAFKRRLMMLFILGLLHLTFVWYGDILHVYAIAGWILYLNRNKSAQTYFKVSMVLFIVSTMIFMLTASESAVLTDGFKLALAQANAAYIAPKYFDLFWYRLSYEIPIVIINLIFILPKILSLFFLGAAIGKISFFQELDRYEKKIDRLWKIVVGVGVLCASGSLLIQGGLFNLHATRIQVLLSEVLTICGALFYALIFIRKRDTKWMKVTISAFKDAGRMALTNYLMQTAVFTTLIYGYGGGWFGKLGMLEYYVLAFIFFSLQLVLSKVWLLKFKQGPFEFLWRKFTYS